MISFDIIDLHCGWATVEIAFEAESIRITFEHLPNDGFVDLIDSAIRMAEGIGSIVCFPNHSAETRLAIIEPCPERMCRIAISECICYNDINRLRNAPKEISVSQVFLVAASDFQRAVLRMFDKYYHCHSSHEFAKEWGDIRGEVERLRASYGKLR